MSTTEGVEARAPLRVEHGSNKADKTQQGYDNAKRYINMYLEEKNLSQFDELTDVDVEGDHLTNFIENIYLWLAVRQFKTNQGWIVPTSKEKLFSQMKMVWKHKSPGRYLWKIETYGKEQEADFKENCKRHRIEDPGVLEVRESAPLYRDLSGTRVPAVRAKCMNEKVDCKVIAMSMIREGSDRSIHKLAEFNLTWQCIGRGGEHLYRRFPECFYDDYFQAPDFDWSMIKQKLVKCSLIYMDRLDYCLCPIWALGIYFLFDGLRRDGYTGTTKDYVFPSLHEMRKEKVADSLTASIKKHIKAQFGKAQSKIYSVRSVRKGAMTENRCNKSLSTQEEYARSRHAAPDTNANAKGYVERTAAMSAPGGALAGYFDPHAHAFPMSFRCISERCKTNLAKFVSILFVNDVECLKEDEKCQELLSSCAACVIGWYRDVKSDIGTDYIIVKTIQHAAKTAELYDEAIESVANVPNWLTTLNMWSRRIKDDFLVSNPDKVEENATLIDQYRGLTSQMASLMARMGGLDTKVTNFERSSSMHQDLLETNRMLSESVETGKAKERDLMKELNKSKWKLDKLKSAMESPMGTSVTGRVDAAGTPLSVSVAATNLNEDVEMAADEEVAADNTEVSSSAKNKEDNPPAKRQRNISNALAALDGVSIASLRDPKEVDIGAELERLYNSKVFQAKKRDADGDGTTVPKHALFDSTCKYFFGLHPIMGMYNKGGKLANVEAMTVAAIAFEHHQWDKMLSGTLGDEEVRMMCNAVNTQAREDGN